MNGIGECIASLWDEDDAFASSLLQLVNGALNGGTVIGGAVAMHTDDFRKIAITSPPPKILDRCGLLAPRPPPGLWGRTRRASLICVKFHL